MADYWVTFRIASDTTYQKRYDKMLEAMIALRGPNASWAEPTSFWLVRSAAGLDAFIRALSASLNARTDLLVVRNTTDGETRYFGALSHLPILMEFFPRIKKSP